jgi:hypothetical protein
MDEKIETQYAIVELMGHKVTSGAVTKDESYGTPLLRVDVPATSAYPQYKQFFGLGTIYCLTPVSQAVAEKVAEGNKANPVSVYCPDLVTREQVEAIQQRYEERLQSLRNQLPSGETIQEELEDADDGVFVAQDIPF